MNNISPQCSQIHFFKYQALGNDYLVIEPDQVFQPLQSNQVTALCDRHYGVGADGVLVGPSPTDEADFSLRIYNPDGSEAEKSGNGLRIFARFLWDQGYLAPNAESKTSSKVVTLLTIGGKVLAQVLEDGKLICIEMGQAIFNYPSPSIPKGANKLATLVIGGESLQFCFVDLGNPHCVIFYQNASEAIARKLGPLIENDARFPNRTNVQFLEVIDRQTLRIQIWERGAGYTQSSGSSSCAAAATAYRFGLCRNNVTVQNPGGDLSVSIDPDYSLRLTGPAVRVFEGYLEKI